MKKFPKPFCQIIIFSFLLISMSSIDEPKEILLWPTGAPGSQGKVGKESVRVTEKGEHVISSIHYPSITPYIPSPSTATGAAVIIAPGGGHRELWIDHEGYNLAHWLRDQGIAAFVLKYRLANEPNSTYTVDDHALTDMQRAIRLVRSHAKKWGIDSNRIGVMGFSAGGEVAALSAMRFDNGKQAGADSIERQSSRPDFQALIYPGKSNRYTVDKNTPPVFILLGYNDRADISIGMAQVYQKYKEAGVPAELHIYAKPGHGFGVKKENGDAIESWPNRFKDWLADMGVIKRAN